MTYVAKSPFLVSQGIGNQGPAIWHHSSADDGATVDTTGFITDGYNLGMKVNDYVIHVDTGTNLITGHVVKTVSATTGAVDLTNTTTIGSGTSGD